LWYFVLCKQYSLPQRRISPRALMFDYLLERAPLIQNNASPFVLS
jgi:hypothetical protein